MNFKWTTKLFPKVFPCIFQIATKIVYNENYSQKFVRFNVCGGEKEGEEEDDDDDEEEEEEEEEELTYGFKQLNKALHVQQDT